MYTQGIVVSEPESRSLLHANHPLHDFGLVCLLQALLPSSAEPAYYHFETPLEKLVSEKQLF